jgi:hypothetical protein
MIALVGKLSDKAIEGCAIRAIADKKIVTKRVMFLFTILQRLLVRP